MSGAGSLMLVLLLVGCASPATPRSEDRAGEEPRIAPLKRISAGLTGEPHVVSPRFVGLAVPGLDRFEEFLNSALVVEDDRGLLQPQLAEVVPTVDNGLWKLFADGRMEMTWHIRQGARWHDGAPLTSDDLAFTTRVEQDVDLPHLRNLGYAHVESLEVVEPLTVIVKWRRPFIDADTMFSRLFAPPLPRHLLEPTYIENKAALLDLLYWTDEFVGTGPYRLREFVRGSYALLEANHSYVLGRPRIDEIEVKFIPEWGALAANILAGVVEITPGGRISFEWAVQVRDQWRDGRLEIAFGSGWYLLYPQFLTPNPPIIVDLRFRRALIYGMDRQEMADSLLGGVVPVAHSIISDRHPERPEVESSIIRYAYDPRRALQLLEEIGVGRGPDGSLRDAAGQRTPVEIRTATAETQHKLGLAVGGYWRQLGVGVESYTIPVQMARELEVYAVFPSFLLVRQPSGVRGLLNLHGSRSPVPENRFVGQNFGRYKNEEFDSLLDTLVVSVPMRERMAVLGQVVRHMTDQLNVIGIAYDPEPILIGSRLRNVPANRPVWNTHEWDVG